MRFRQLPLFFIVFLHGAAAFSITDTAQLERVGIREKLGYRIPGDIVLVNHLGKKETIGSFFDGKNRFFSSLFSTPALTTAALR